MKATKSHLIPSRSPKRAHFEPQVIHSILDEALFCTISYVKDDMPFSIPTSFVRIDDKIHVHGSVGSHFIREIESGIPVCITVMLADELVVAKSAFSHSVNYRSVVIFAKAELTSEEAAKYKVLKCLTEKIVPGSWDYLRPMTDKEVQKTTALAFSLTDSSAKIRSGMPNDEPEDKALMVWSGLIPLSKERLSPIPDESSQGILLPDHLS
jgi:nitroimidazol reductase NimA-like FMN-containing flavoprotein (pyridoxamine 5'-phosphate oxidase superfamily)